MDSNNSISISFSGSQIAHALLEMGFEATEKNVVNLADYVNNGIGNPNFESAFNAMIAVAGADLQLPKVVK